MSRWDGAPELIAIEDLDTSLAERLSHPVGLIKIAPFFRLQPLCEQCMDVRLIVQVDLVRRVTLVIVCWRGGGRGGPRCTPDWPQTRWPP